MPCHECGDHEPEPRRPDEYTWCPTCDRAWIQREHWGLVTTSYGSFWSKHKSMKAGECPTCTGIRDETSKPLLARIAELEERVYDTKYMDNAFAEIERLREEVEDLKVPCSKCERVDPPVMNTKDGKAGDRRDPRDVLDKIRAELRDPRHVAGGQSQRAIASRYVRAVRKVLEGD